MNDYDKTWQIVEAMARTKLLMNDHKGRIEAVNPGKLLTLASKEIEELRDAIARDNYMDVIEEAADTLNFITAAAHQVIHMYRTRDEHTRQITAPNHKEMDDRTHQHAPISSRPQLGGSSDCVGDRKEDGPTPSSNVTPDKSRIISRSGRSEGGGHTDSD